MADKELTTSFLWNACKETINVINTSIEKATENLKDNPQELYNAVSAVNKELKPTQEQLIDMFDQVLGRIRSHMVIGRDQFFGLELLQMELKTDLKVSPKPGEEPITTDVNSMPMVMKINPLFLGDYSAAHIESMIVSELLAISFSYPLKFNRINKAGDPALHKALNRAASVSTTELVKKYITIDRAAKKPGMKISDHAYTVEDLRNDTLLNAKEKETLEYYYSVYRKNPPETDSGDSKDSQSYVSLMSNDSDLMSTPNFRNENQKNSVHNWEGQYNPQDLETRIKSLVNKAYDEFNKSSRRGTIPESLEKEIEFLRSKPKINWRKKLADLIGSITVPFRKSPARLNKKYPERTDLSGRLPKHKTRIVCILDTSGSMSDSDYTYCINEVLNVSNANETEVTVIECDTKVSGVYVLNAAKRLKKVTRTSCGGTCFSPAIEYVNQNNYRDAVCIYFTDGFGEDEIPKPRVQKMMWVVLDKVENLSVKQPYGSVCSLVDDEKYKMMKGV